MISKEAFQVLWDLARPFADVFADDTRAYTRDEDKVVNVYPRKLIDSMVFWGYLELTSKASDKTSRYQITVEGQNQFTEYMRIKHDSPTDFTLQVVRNRDAERDRQLNSDLIRDRRADERRELFEIKRRLIDMVSDPLDFELKNYEDFLSAYGDILINVLRDTIKSMEY